MMFAKGDAVLVSAGRQRIAQKPAEPTKLDEDDNPIPEPVQGTPGVIMEIYRGKARVMYLIKGGTPLSPNAKFTREAIWVSLDSLRPRQKLKDEEYFFFVDPNVDAKDDELIDETDEWEADDAGGCDD